MNKILQFIFLVSLLLLLPGTNIARQAAPAPPELLKAQVLPPAGLSLTADEVARLAMLQNLDIETTRLILKEKSLDELIADSRFDTTASIAFDYAQNNEQQPSIVIGDRTIKGGLKTSLEKKNSAGFSTEVFFNAFRNESASSFNSLNPNYESHAGIVLKKNLTQNLFGMLDRNEIKKIRLDIESAGESSVFQTEQSILSARLAYWELLRSVKYFELRKNSYETSRDFYDIVQSQLETGLQEEKDLFAVEAHLRSRLQDLLQSQLEANITMNQLKLAIFSHADLLPEENFPDRKIDQGLEEMLSGLSHTRRDLRSKQLELESAGVEIKIASLQKIPRLNLTASLGSNSLDRDQKSSQGEIFSFKHLSYFIGVEFKFPIEARRPRAELEKARLHLARQAKEFEKQVYSAQLDIESAYQTYLISREIHRQAELAASLEEQKFQAEKNHFKIGRSTSKTLIDFQQDATTARIRSLNAETVYQKAFDQLLFARGSLLRDLDLEEPSRHA